jgi:hypothetical protein
VEKEMTRDEINLLCSELENKNKFIEAGWTYLKLVNASQELQDFQLRIMRKVYFAGAMRMYHSIISALIERGSKTDPEAEPEAEKNLFDHLSVLYAELCEYKEGVMKEETSH